MTEDADVRVVLALAKICMQLLKVRKVKETSYLL